jgi:hypothetical protein
MYKKRSKGKKIVIIATSTSSKLKARWLLSLVRCFKYFENFTFLHVFQFFWKFQTKGLRSVRERVSVSRNFGFARQISVDPLAAGAAPHHAL